MLSDPSIVAVRAGQLLPTEPAPGLPVLQLLEVLPPEERLVGGPPRDPR